MDENEEERSIGKRAIRNWNKMRLKGKVVEKIRKKEKRNKENGKRGKVMVSRGGCIRSRSQVSNRREGRFEATGISRRVLSFTRHATIPRDHRAEREVKV